MSNYKRKEKKTESFSRAEDASSLIHRLRFLKALEKVTNAAESLRDKLPLYASCLSETSNIHTWQSLNSSAERLEVALKLRNAVDAWSKRHHLTDEWLLETALNSLAWWHTAKVTGQVQKFEFVYPRSDPRKLPASGDTENKMHYHGFLLTPEVMWWLPFSESEAEFNKKLKNARVSETRRKKFFRDAIRELKDKNAIRPRKKRVSIHHDDGIEHYKWVAGYQDGLTFDAVGKRHGLNTDHRRNTVGDVVRELAKHMGLTLRVE